MRRRLWLTLTAHTMFLIVVFFVLLRLPYTYDNESQVISWVSIFKNVLFGLEKKPDKKDFLLVNISYQKQLISKYDAYDFEIGNEAITDRSKLAEFFLKLAPKKHRIVVCDVFLDRPSENDSALSPAVANAGLVLFPYHNVDGVITKPVVDVPSALSDYHSDFGNFTKYTFAQYDTCSTIALTMHKLLDGHEYTEHTLFSSDDGEPVLNSFILDFPIRQFDIFREDTLGYSSIHLQNLLSLPAPLFNEMVQGKIIVVGDFLENDFHNTLYGSTAGPLIHLNAFLSLHEHKHRISLPFMVYLVVCSALLSWMLFGGEMKTRITWIERLEKSKLGWVMDYLKYASFLLLISVVSYLLFGIYLNILLVSLYFSVFENVKEFFERKLELKSNV